MEKVSLGLQALQKPTVSQRADVVPEKQVETNIQVQK